MRHSMSVTNPDNHAESYIVDSYHCHMRDSSTTSTTATATGDSSGNTKDMNGNSKQRSTRSTDNK